MDILTEYLKGEKYRNTEENKQEKGEILNKLSMTSIT